MVVADTSCLILFRKIDQLELLRKVFGKITVTSTVEQEYKNDLPEWVQIINPSTNLHIGLSQILDKGEATSIALASENTNSLLIIDELKGRRLAADLDIPVTGTLGVLLAAKKKGEIDEVSSLIEKIRETNFHLSKELIQKVLQLANEA